MARGSESPLGTEKVSQNGYLYRKIKDREGKLRWELVSRILAEEKLGRALHGDEYVTFVDGDKTNLDPENITVRVRGKQSLRKRLAQVEARIAEYSAIRNEILERLKVQEQL